MEKIRVYIEDPQTGERRYGSVTIDKLQGALAKGFKVAEQQAKPVAAPAEPAAAPMPAAAPAESGFYESYVKPVVESPFVVGAERGLTAEFAPALSGAASLLASKVMPAAEGVAPEFLDQEDWYLRGREEQKAMQQRLQEESPWLTGAGAITGALLGAKGATMLRPAAGAAGAPVLTMAPGAAAASRIAQAIPGAMAYGAATGAGRTDIIGTQESTSEKAGELAGNVAFDAAMGIPAAIVGQTLVPAAARQLRRPLTWAQQQVQQYADKALLAKAGPQIAERLEAGTLGGVDQPEVVRVMREAGMGRRWGPEALQTEAKAAAEESGGMLGRMRAEIDRQATALKGRAAESRASGEAKQKELTARYADKLKAAQEAAAKADELEKMASSASSRLSSEQAELHKAATTSGVAPPAKTLREPGVMRLTEQGAQQADVAAAEEADRTRRFMAFLDPKLRQTVEGEVSAAAPPRTLPPAPMEEPLDIRSVVGASKALKSRQREVEIMQAAAKKAREEADRLMKEAKPTSYEHAQAQMDIIEAERLAGEAGKRMISGKDVGAVFRKEAESLFKAEGGTTPAAIQDEGQRRLYKALIDQARAAESTGMMTLEQANAKVQGLKNMAKWEKSALFSPVDLPPKIEAGRTASRGLAAAETEAAAQAEATPEMAEILASRYARMGRGKSTEAPRPEEALGGLRRTYQVSKALEESAAEEAKRIKGLPAMPSVRTTKEGWLSVSPSPQMTAQYVPSLKSALAETAVGGLRSAESLPSAMPTSAQAYMEMLDAIQKSYETEQPEEPMSMVQQ